MFDLKRLGLFLGKALLIAVPFLLIAAALGFLTEIVTWRGELGEALLSARFWQSVAIDMVPVTAAMALTLLLPALYLRSFYQLGSWRDGLAFLLRHRCGLYGFGPWVKVAEGRVEETGGRALKQVGGPGHLVIYNDSAALLARGGRLTRIATAGFPELYPFEMVYDVVDLRPKRAVRTVDALSREGILIHWDVEIQYQIQLDEAKISEQAPYPVSPAQVLRAATCKWMYAAGGPGVVDWEGRLLLEAERILRTLLAERQLDHLINHLDNGQRAAREAVQAELEEALRRVAPRVGARILWVKLDNLRVDDAVTQQWIRAWRTQWETWSATQLAPAEASFIHQYETSKAEAQIQMVQRIAKELQERIDSQAIPSQAVPQMVLLRLFSVLDRADFAPASRVFFPTQTMHALEDLRRVLGSGRPTDGVKVTLRASPPSIPVDGECGVDADVLDAWGSPVPDDTLVSFSTTLGTLSVAEVLTTGGKASTRLKADGRAGLASVSASSGGASGSTIVRIG